jgi:hypothetical protein
LLISQTLTHTFRTPTHSVKRAVPSKRAARLSLISGAEKVQKRAPGEQLRKAKTRRVSMSASIWTSKKQVL